MKKIIWTVSFLLLFMPLWAGSGVNFMHGLSWQQLLIKAKAENKFIFIDCYASWCGPCKKMDREVYVNDAVGEYLNARFLSIKLQMDTSKNDSLEVKKLYQFAKDIRQKYDIRSYPTYLFFSPEGKAVHRGLGVKDKDTFIKLASEAETPSMQYYVLQDKYRDGSLDIRYLPSLAYLAKEFSDDGLSKEVSIKYMREFLSGMDDDSLYNRSNLVFISSFRQVLSSSDPLFKRILRDSVKVGSTMNSRSFSSGIVDYVIKKEDIQPILSEAMLTGKDINWNKMARKIKEKYGSSFGERNILSSKSDFYQKRKQWSRYTAALVQQVDFIGIENIRPGVINGMFLNNNAWGVFQYSSKKRELQRALAWSERALQMGDTAHPDPARMDTKANILYKLGYKPLAIELEKKVVSLAPSIQMFKETLQKMKQGYHTWD